MQIQLQPQSHVHVDQLLTEFTNSEDRGRMCIVTIITLQDQNIALASFNDPQRSLGVQVPWRLVVFELSMAGGC